MANTQLPSNSGIDDINQYKRVIKQRNTEAKFFFTLIQMILKINGNLKPELLNLICIKMGNALIPTMEEEWMVKMMEIVKLAVLVKEKNLATFVST